MERLDKRQAGADSAYGLPLNPDAFPMDEAQMAEALLPGGFQVGFRYGGDIARRDGMKIEDIGDGEFHNLITKIGDRFHRVFSGVSVKLG